MSRPTIENQYLFHYLTGLKTAGADSDPTRLAVDAGIDRFQIDIEAPFREIMSLADIMPYAGLLAAYFANLCHLLLRLRMCRVSRSPDRIGVTRNPTYEYSPSK